MSYPLTYHAVAYGNDAFNRTPVTIDIVRIGPDVITFRVQGWDSVFPDFPCMLQLINYLKVEWSAKVMVRRVADMHWVTK